MPGYDDLIGAAVAEFLSGDDMMGSRDVYSAGLLGDMADIAGAEFVSGATDPVSALLGMDDISGADLLGFSMNPLNLFRKKKAHQALVKHAINAKLQKSGAAIVPRANAKARRFPSPLTATVVAGGAAATIPSNPQVLYRPERLIIPASIAPSFSVTDIKVGNVSQFPTTGEVPGEVFAQNGWDASITLDTVNPAINLSVSVINLTGGSLTFRGAFIGTAVQ